MLTKGFCGSLVFLVALSACGSSGSGGDQDVEFELVQSLQTRASTAEVALPEDLPGAATMSGYIGLNIDGEANPIYGDMNMQVNFGNGDIEATASDLGIYQDVGGCMSDCELVLLQSLNGELTLGGDGEIFNVNSFDGTLSGDLTSNTDHYDISIFVDGGFLIDDEGLLASATLDGTGDEVLITPIGGGPAISSNATGLFIVAE